MSFNVLVWEGVDGSAQVEPFLNAAHKITRFSKQVAIFAAK
jgi:hypothetical protein